MRNVLASASGSAQTATPIRRPIARAIRSSNRREIGNYASIERGQHSSINSIRIIRNDISIEKAEAARQ